MQHINYHDQLLKITNFNCSKETKKSLLQSLLTELRLKISLQAWENNKINNIEVTQETICSQPSIDLSEVISKLEKKIIMKRDVKFELNEEIQEAEEELESLNTAVLVKKQLDDEMKCKIRKMFEIQMNAYQKQQKQKEKEPVKTMKANKTFSILSNKFLNLFN